MSSTTVCSRSNGVLPIRRRHLISVLRASDMEMYFVQRKLIEKGVLYSKTAIGIDNVEIPNKGSLAKFTVGCTSIHLE